MIGVPDPRTGKRALDFVVLADGVDPLSLPELAEHCRAQELANQKIPELLEIIDQLPRNSMGKILKQDRRERYLHRTFSGVRPRS